MVARCWWPAIGPGPPGDLAPNANRPGPRGSVDVRRRPDGAPILHIGHIGHTKMWCGKLWSMGAGGRCRALVPASGWSLASNNGSPPSAGGVRSMGFPCLPYFPYFPRLVCAKYGGKYGRRPPDRGGRAPRSRSGASTNDSTHRCQHANADTGLPKRRGSADGEYPSRRGCAGTAESTDRPEQARSNRVHSLCRWCRIRHPCRRRTTGSAHGDGAGKRFPVPGPLAYHLPDLPGDRRTAGGSDGDVIRPD
jgi:hypothetical protein